MSKSAIPFFFECLGSQRQTPNCSKSQKKLTKKPASVGLEELTPGNVQDGVRDWERIYLEQEDSGERDGRTAGDGSGPDVGTVTEGEWATAEDPGVCLAALPAAGCLPLVVPEGMQNSCVSAVLNLGFTERAERGAF